METLNPKQNIETYKDGHVLSTEVAALRIAVGWDPLTDKLEAALSNTQTQYSMRDAGRLIGFVRVVGDGCVHAHIVDLTIHPDYQHRGLGTGLVKKVITDLKEDGINFISLTYDRNLEDFYRKSGFEVCGGGIIK
jgi:ribosomal protein S18 acetylase RimI-like enzyme